MTEKKQTEAIAQARERWEEGPLAKTLGRFPEQKERFTTTSAVEVERLYTPLERQEEDYLEQLGFPGQHPFTRGVQPTMYRGRFWTMRQYAGFASARETNERYHYLLERGQTGLSVAFDLPTQMGYDSDHPLARGEVGRTGVAIDSLREMEILFEGIPLDRISTSMTINSTAAILLSMYLVLAEKQQLSLEKVRGTIQNDLLKEYAARGTYIYPPQPSMRIITDIFAYCKEKVPSWNPISISGYHIREAGSTAVQEVAFTLANGIAYVEAAVRAGLAVDEFAGRLSFFFASQNNLLEEVAKFRAARRLWARIMRERFGAKKERSCALRFHTQTAGCTLTAQQPDNNVVRVTIQALAAVLGGTQSLHTNSRDEALALPSEESARIALRTQQVLAHESGVTDTIDPLAGSYYVETLTDKIEEKASEYIEKIDGMGGAIRAIEQGFMQEEIARSSYEFQMEVEGEKQVVVGVNRFLEEEVSPPALQRIDPQVEATQIERLSRTRAERDPSAVEKALARLKEAAQGEENLMPLIIEAVRVYATVGEISETFREVFGVHRESL